MSKELEMLRVVKDLRDHSTYSFAVFDLKAILARLEAAERVAESAVQYSVKDNMVVVMAVNKDAVAAYRALDGKGEGDEPPPTHQDS